MLVTTFLAVFCGALLSSAQDDGDATVFVENEITVHLVTVGLEGHVFAPDAITANPGDKLMFQFYAGNHSVIQSEYGWPCIPSEAVDGQSGFYSGPQQNATDDNPTVWNLTITHTGPVFFYCGAPGSCVNFAMLGGINLDSSVNLTGQQELAKEARYVLYPNQTMSSDARASISALADTVLERPTTPSATPTQTVQTSAPAATTSAASNHKHGLSSGAIAGIAVGGVAVLAILGALIFYFGRTKGQIQALQDTVNREHHERHGPPEMTVDGVTYVPRDSRVVSLKPSLIQRYGSPEMRSKSPESSMYGPPMDSSANGPQAAGPHYQSRYSGATATQEYGFYAPSPRHEMPVATSPAPPDLPLQPVDIERLGGSRNQHERL